MSEITDLEELSDGLAQATDDLNQEFVKVETALNALMLGVSAEIPLTFGNVEQLLGFGKVGNKGWILYIRQNTPESGKSSLTSSSRQARVQAANRLPDLLARLQLVAKSQLTEVQNATLEVQKVHGLLDQLLKR